MRPAAFTFALLLTPALRADGLADLRAALQRLPASQSVKATVDCQVWNRSGKAKQPKIVQGRVQAKVEDGPSGLKLGWDRSELDRIQSSAKAKPKDGGPKQAMDALSADKTEALLDAAKELLTTLDGAQVQEDRADTWQGKPARLLTLKLDMKDMDEEDRKHLKSYDHLMKVWMDPSGTPLGLSDQLDLKGSFFLISFEMHHRGSRTLARAGDRLISVHDESEDNGSGAGEQSSQKTTMDVKF